MYYIPSIISPNLKPIAPQSDVYHKTGYKMAGMLNDVCFTISRFELGYLNGFSPFIYASKIHQVLMYQYVMDTIRKPVV